MIWTSCCFVNTLGGLSQRLQANQSVGLVHLGFGEVGETSLDHSSMVYRLLFLSEIPQTLLLFNDVMVSELNIYAYNSI